MAQVLSRDAQIVRHELMLCIVGNGSRLVGCLDEGKVQDNLMQSHLLEPARNIEEIQDERFW